MPPDESPEAKFERLKKQLQESILRDYPNPERKGCPGDPTLKELAERPLGEAIEGDPHWQHVTHCSECYRQFLEFNEDFRRQKNTQRATARLALGAVGALVIAAGLIFAIRQTGLFSPRPQNAELVYSQRTIDIPSISRSAESGGGTPAILLERKPTALTVQLPVGSKSGTYEFELRTEKVTRISRSADATLRNGVTTFTVRLTLSELEPGMYSVYVRRVPWDWTYFPVEIR